MKLVSSIELDGFPFYVVFDQELRTTKWFLFSLIHPSKYALSKEEREKDMLDLYTLTHSSKISSEYLVEGVIRSNTNGSVKVYKSSLRLDKVMNALVDARDFGYTKDETLRDETSVIDLVEHNYFTAYHGNEYSISYHKENNIITSLKYKANTISLDFIPNNLIKLPRSLEYKEKTKGKNVIDVLSINQVDVESLSKVVDLSWYWNPETLEVKKNYISIDTIRDFESKVITPMVHKILKEHSEGIISVISCDTETTGFKLLFLNDTNPDKDHITTIQFAWEDDQGVIVYLGMEYFSNLPKEYVLSRVFPLFRFYVDRKRPFSFKLLYSEDGNKIDEDVTLCRDWYLLTGHNVIFDSRVSKCEGDGKPLSQLFFDLDTLQMAFNLDPTVTKGSKGLKRLTRYFFHEETPELVDILGKGNEGNFRLLKDRRITEIYGCADVDYSRKLVKVLKDLTPSKMYKSYRHLDPMMWYLAAGSEYYGMRLDMKHVEENSKRIQADLENLQNFIYVYVGAVLRSRARLIEKGVDPSKLEAKESLDIDSSECEPIELDEGEKFEFKLAGNDLKNVMYKRLKYPVLSRSRKTGEPSVDKNAFKRLLYHKNEKSSGILKKDFLSTDGKTVLIEAKKFNSYKYPLCYVLQEYKSLDKEYTTYYKPFEEEDLEGRLFKSISTYNIETRRISSAAQIIKKSLKKAVISHGPDYYLVDWDLNQVEARIFTSLSGDKEGIERLNDYEKDYHTENAASMYDTPAYLVSKSQRKDAKSIGFGIPYGLSLYSLCERLYTEHNAANEAATRVKMSKFEKAQKYEMDYLNGIRDRSIIPRDVPVELKRFWGLEDDAPVGIVENKDGFWRYFDLTNVLGDPKEEGRVKRAAGNFPIQSYAADLYRVLLKRFYTTLAKHHLLDKVVFHMYIHDELLFSVHKSIDPRIIAKLCAESCMMKLKNQTTYYIGLAFGSSWYECKKDENELPTGFLLEIKNNIDSYKLQDWTDDPCTFMKQFTEDYTRRRTMDVIKQYVPNLGKAPIDIDKLLNRFENYTVRGYLYDLKPAFKIRTRKNNRTGKLEEVDSDKFLSCLCSLFVSFNMEDIILVVDDKEDTVANIIASRKREEFKIIDVADELDSEDDDDEIDSLYWSFDEDEDSDNEDSLMSQHVLYMYEEEPEIEDHADKELLKYHNLQVLGEKAVIINLPRITYVQDVLNYIKSDKVTFGYQVEVQTAIGSFSAEGFYDCNWKNVDNYIDTLLHQNEDKIIV